MIITKYIAKSCILPELEATSKPEAVKELTHLLFDKKRMKNVAPALDQVVAREATESTGIGHGIAVPHARIPGMKNLACSVGRIPAGLEFMAVDRKPVYLVLLICYPPTQQTVYLNFVATVAKLLSDKENQNKVLAAKTADEIHGTLQQLAEDFTATHEKAVKKVKADPGIYKVHDGHVDLILLARLQLEEELLSAAKTGKKRIREHIEGMRLMIDPRILRHYEKLTAGRAPALVPVEGDTCQGCFIRLPSKFVQQVRQDPEHIHTCINCSRYIYVV